MSDVWRELEERLKQKAKSLNELVQDSKKFQSFIEHLASYRDADLLKAWRTLFEDNKWVRLEDVKEAIQQLKQRVCEVIDQYIKAYPLDTPEDRQVSKVLNEIREELLKT